MSLNSIKSKTDIIKNALLTVGVPVSHYTAYQQEDKYLVWAEEGQTDALWADGNMDEQTIEGTLDYFTKSENDTNIDKIQNALNEAEISFILISVQREDDTGYIHYEWAWEV